MYKRLFIAFLLLTILAVGAGVEWRPGDVSKAAPSLQATDIYVEDFETDGLNTRYTSDFVCNDGFFDFFTRTDGSDITAAYGDPASGGYTGENGSFYWAAMDTDVSECGAGNPTHQMDFNQVNTSGYTNLEFSVLAAARQPAQDGNYDHDIPDGVRFQYSLDGAAYVDFLCFSSIPDDDTFNSIFALDADCDGDAEGTGAGTASPVADFPLSQTFQSFTATIPGTPSTVDIRFVVDTLDSGDEDFAFDYLRIRGDAVSDAPPTVTSTTPNDSAFNVAVDANIDLNFSENVAFDGTSFTITGSTSGSVAASVSGSGSSYTLDPTSDFAAGETVTVTLVADNITDEDGGNDTLDGNGNGSAEGSTTDDYTFSFSIAASAPTIVINEFAAKGTEAVELYNAGSGAADIGGWYLDDADCGSGSSTITAGTNIVAGGFFVVNAGDAGDNFDLNNSGDVLVLCDDTNTEIDRVAYSDTGGAPVGPTANTVARVSDGVDTDDFAADFNLAPASTIGSTNNNVPAVNLGGGTILVNELDPFANSGTEFVELYNPSGSPVDITGWGLSDSDGLDTLSGTVPAMGYLVLYLGTDYTASNFSTGDVAYLYDDNGIRVDQLGYNNGPFINGCVARVPDGAGPNDSFDWASANGGTELFDQNCTPNATNDLSADIPPTVTSTTPNDSAFNVAVDANIDLNFSENVAFDGTSFTITGSTSGSVAASVSGSGSSYTLDPASDFAAGETVTVTLVADNITDEDGGNDSLDGNGNGSAEGSTTDDYTFSFTIAVADACGNPATLISAIQGTGAVSPLDGSGVTIEAIVVGDYQATGSDPRPELSGFYVQEEDADVDGDINTSEGIFVYDPAQTLDVQEGDLVRVTGTVSEYFDQTQVDSVSSVIICSSGNSVTPASIDLPVPDSFASVDEFYERFEGMLVDFVDTMTVTEYFELARYGQILMSEGGRLRQYSQDGSLPLNTTDFNEFLDDNNRRSIFLDDFNQQQNIDPVFHPQPGGFSTSNYIRGGATVDLTGVLNYSFSEWRVQPQQSNPVSFNNPARPAAPALSGTITVGAFNVLNYFNGDGLGGGFPTQRGADSQTELDRQTDKLVQAIIELDPSVLGLMEIENDGDNANDALAYLVDALNAVAGAGTYDYVRAGTNGGSDDIKVALIYQPALVSPVGSRAVLDTDAFTDPNNTTEQKNRPALAQTFQVTDASNADFGESFTVVVLHLKSKGSGCGAGDDDTIQGNCNGTRTDAATELLNWLATDPTDTATNLGAVDEDILIIGDFNAYYQEDPMQVFYNAGYVNAHPQSSYSYVFDGQWGSLDHIIMSPSMVSQVVSADKWHINADENSLLDYNDTVQDPSEQSYEAKPPTNDLYDPDPYRTSDHDPIIVGLNMSGADLPDDGDSDQPDVGVADPAISKIGELQPGQLGLPGETLTWIVTVSNNGGAAASNLVISDQLRSELRVDSATSERGTVSINGQTVTVTIPSLGAGESFQIRIVTTVLSNPDASVFQNDVTLTADGGFVEQASAQVSAVNGLPDTGYPPAQNSSDEGTTIPWAIVLAVVVGLVLGGGVYLRRRANTV